MENGAFSNKDAGIRREAVEVTKEMMDIAEELMFSYQPMARPGWI